MRKLCGPCERFSHREHLGHVVLAWTSEYFKNSKEYPDQKIEFSKLKHESNLFFYLLGGGWDVHKIVTSIVTCPPPPPPPPPLLFSSRLQDSGCMSLGTSATRAASSH